jgi:hypothetical protein
LIINTNYLIIITILWQDQNAGRRSRAGARK